VGKCKNKKPPEHKKHKLTLADIIDYLPQKVHIQMKPPGRRYYLNHKAGELEIIDKSELEPFVITEMLPAYSESLGRPILCLMVEPVTWEDEAYDRELRQRGSLANTVK